jgi:hypothetical protein
MVGRRTDTADSLKDWFPPNGVGTSTFLSSERISMPFFVWADRLDALAGLPSELHFADHTWVTTYRPVRTCPPNEVDGEYWYCYGSCHTTPPSNVRARRLAEGEGDIEFARRISNPHDPADDVGLRYGVFGVCHQMANRLTYFARDTSGEPLTTENAKMYGLSAAIYGEYGGKGPLGSAVRLQWQRTIADWEEFRKAQESFHDA